MRIALACLAVVADKSGTFSWWLSRWVRRVPSRHATKSEAPEHAVDHRRSWPRRTGFVSAYGYYSIDRPDRRREEVAGMTDAASTPARPPRATTLAARLPSRSNGPARRGCG